MTTLALPDPQSVAIAQVPEIARQAQAIRAEAEGANDSDTVLELHRRLEALEKYLSDKDAAHIIAAESRLTEALIGKLLGPAEHGGSRQGASQVESFNLNGLDKRYRHDFRTLGEHEEEIKALVAEGVVKRAALLRAVNGTRAPRMEPCPTCGRPMRADKPARGGER